MSRCSPHKKQGGIEQHPYMMYIYIYIYIYNILYTSTEPDPGPSAEGPHGEPFLEQGPSRRLPRKLRPCGVRLSLALVIRHFSSKGQTLRGNRVSRIGI